MKKNAQKKIKVEEPENENALKHLFNRQLLKRMSDGLAGAHPAFDRKHFMGLMPTLEKLEMKSRVRLLRDEIRQQLPAEFPKALEILLRSMKAGKLQSFDLWPYTEFVQTYGLDDPQISLEALKEMTRVFTAEWAIRPFIQKYPEETMKFLLRCARDSDVHLRRWASEGSRPRLPWGERLHEFVRDPAPTLPILNILKFDSELYVRKSVANHLNDISKDHPELVVQVLGDWQKQAGSEHAAKIDWIIHRSLRTLIKNGHAGALVLIGVSPNAALKLVDLKVRRKKIKLGERMEFQFTVHSQSSKPQALVVDYIIHFVKANRRLAPKVFKLKRIEIPARGRIQIEKSHHFKKITTRDYHPGKHLLETQINGRVVGRQEWILSI